MSRWTMGAVAVTEFHITSSSLRPPRASVIALVTTSLSPTKRTSTPGNALAKAAGTHSTSPREGPQIITEPSARAFS